MHLHEIKTFTEDARNVDVWGKFNEKRRKQWEVKRTENNKMKWKPTSDLICKSSNLNLKLFISILASVKKFLFELELEASTWGLGNHKWTKYIRNSILS